MLLAEVIVLYREIVDRTVRVRCVRKGKSLVILKKGAHYIYCCLLQGELYSNFHNYSDFRRCEHAAVLCALHCQFAEGCRQVTDSVKHSGNYMYRQI